jgi:hypothetical protein
VAAARACRVKRAPRNPFDLITRVAHRVVRRLTVWSDAARLAVVQPARQLAHHEHVCACQYLRLQRTRAFEPRPHTRGTKIRVEVELFPDRKQRGFRPLGWGAAVESRIADGAQQDRIRVLRRAPRRIRQRRQPAPDRCAADGGL